MRNEDEIKGLIDSAILEVVETFKDEISARDREMLQAVTKESTDPFARVVYLAQIRGALGVSEKMTDYINQVLQTLRQELTEAEKLRFQGIGRSILDEIN